MIIIIVSQTQKGDSQQLNKQIKIERMLNKKQSSSTLKLNSYKIDTQALQNNIKQLTQIKYELETTLSHHKSQQDFLVQQNQRLKQQISMLQKKTIQKSNHTQCQIKILKLQGELKQKRKQNQRLKELIQEQKKNKQIINREYQKKLEKLLRENQISVDKYQQRITLLNVQLNQNRIALQLTNQKYGKVKHEKGQLEKELLRTLELHKQIHSSSNNSQVSFDRNKNRNSMRYDNSSRDEGMFDSRNGHKYINTPTQLANIQIINSNEYQNSSSSNRMHDTENENMVSNMSYSSSSNMNPQSFNNMHSLNKHNIGNSQLSDRQMQDNRRFSHNSRTHSQVSGHNNGSMDGNSNHPYSMNINIDSNKKLNSSQQYTHPPQKQYNYHLKMESSENESVPFMSMTKNRKQDSETQAYNQSHYYPHHNNTNNYNYNANPPQSNSDEHNYSNSNSKVSISQHNNQSNNSRINKYNTTQDLPPNIQDNNGYQHAYTDRYLGSQEEEQSFQAQIRKLYQEMKSLGMSPTQIKYLPQIKRMTVNENPSIKDIQTLLKSAPIQQKDQTRILKSSQYIQRVIKNKHGGISGKHITQLIISRVQEYQNSSKLNTQDLQISDMTPQKSKSSSSYAFRNESSFSHGKFQSYEMQRGSKVSIQDNVINEEEHSFS